MRLPLLRSQCGALDSRRSGVAAGELLKLLVEHLPAVIWTTDRGLRFTSSFGRALEDLGLRPGELVGLSLSDYFQTTDPDYPLIAAHRRALEGERAALWFPWNERIFQAHLEPLPGGGRQIRGVLGLAVDVTEQECAERERLASEQRYRRLFEDALDVIFTLDLRGNFTSLNRAAERVSGYKRSELLGASVNRLLEPEAARYVAERIQRALGGETTAEFELPILTKDGRRVFLDVSARLQFVNGRPAGVQGIARDITERKRLEEQVRQTQRLEAIGELAGGVAHDFNNLLSAILGYADLLKANSKSGELVYEAAGVIQNAGERAQQLSARLLGYARRGKSQHTAVDVHALLDELLALLERTLPKDITLVKSFGCPQATVMGDPGQLQQVFMNLALNARDAMPQGGTLSLLTELVELDTETFRLLGAAGPGPHVKISVSDTGVGIAPEILPRLFEPFFTTKGRSGGTGMGLAMVYGIVKNHGGAVEVHSQPSRGATFAVYLPSAPVLPLPARQATQAPARGTGCVLVVDDEETVGRATTRMLEFMGYQAVWAGDSQEAVEILRSAPDGFDIVLLDLLMPGLTGQDCYEAMKAVRPDLRVIVTSGYVEDGAAQRLLDMGAAAFLPKPFHLTQLSAVLQQVLGN